MLNLTSMLSTKSNTGDPEHYPSERFQDTLRQSKHAIEAAKTKLSYPKAATGKPKQDVPLRHTNFMHKTHRQQTGQHDDMKNSTVESQHNNKQCILFHNDQYHHKKNTNDYVQLLDEQDILTDLDLSQNILSDTPDQFDESAYKTEYNTEYDTNVIQSVAHLTIPVYDLSIGAHDEHVEVDSIHYHAADDMFFTPYDQSHRQVYQSHLDAEEIPMHQKTDGNTLEDTQFTLNTAEQKLVDTFMHSQEKQDFNENQISRLTDVSNHQQRHPDTNLWVMDHNRENPVSMHNQNIHNQQGLSIFLTQADDAPNIQSKEIVLEIISEKKSLNDYSMKFTDTHKNTQLLENQIVELKRNGIVPLQLSIPQTKDETPDPFKNSTFITQHTHEGRGIEQENTHNSSMDFSQFSGLSHQFKGSVEQAKQIVHHLISANPAIEFIETLRQHFKSFNKSQNPRLTVNMRHNGKSLTIHFMSTQTDHMHITFRTKDKEWEKLLADNHQMIADLFNTSHHTINIKYLGDTE